MSRAGPIATNQRAIERLVALGVPQRRIAQALGVHESSLATALARWGTKDRTNARHDALIEAALGAEPVLVRRIKRALHRVRWHPMNAPIRRRPLHPLEIEELLPVVLDLVLEPAPLEGDPS